MKHLKRWLALLLSAVLALTFLSACGTGGISSSSLAQLLSGELENVTVTGDANFDRALKAAVQKGGSDPDAVLAALKEELAISGGTLSFSISGLGGGSAGRQGLSVLFEPGINPTAAANNAATSWLGVLRGLAGSGAYSAHVSMVQVKGGYILAIAVTVEQPGNLGSDDDDDDTPDPEPAPITSPADLIKAILNNDGSSPITLTSEYTSSDLTRDVLEKAGIENGILNFGGATVVLTGNKPLFNTISEDVTLSGLKIQVNGSIDTGIVEGNHLYVSPVAVTNKGTITNCDVTINSNISANATGPYSIIFTGFVAAVNYGTIQDCFFTITGNGSITGPFSSAFVCHAAVKNHHTIQNCSLQVDGSLTIY